jgi:DNA polymerase-4
VRKRGFAARTIGIKIRFADFRTVTRVRTLPGWTNADADIYDTAVDLYRGLRLDRPRIRLVGVKCEGLRKVDDVAEQLTLDLAPRRAPVAVAGPAAAVSRPSQAAQAAVDAARRRFGESAVRAGTLLTEPEPRRPEPDT